MNEPNLVLFVWRRLGSAAPFVFLFGAMVVLGGLLLLVDPLFVLVGFIGIAMMAAILSKPFYGVVLYLALLYVRPGDLVPALEPLRLTLLGVALLTGAFALQVIVYRQVKPILTPSMIFMVLFLGAIILSIPGSYYRSASMDKMTEVARTVFMSYLIVHLIDTLPRLRSFMYSLVLIMGGLSTALVIRFFTQPWTRVDNGGSGGMIGGFLGDGNDFALAQNVILPWAITLYAHARRRFSKMLLLYAIMVGMLAVGCTYSRGGALGLIALLLTLYLIWTVRTKKYMLGVFLALVGLTVASILFLALAPADFVERMTSIKDYEQDESARGRLDAWRAGVHMFADHPFFGVGAGVFSEAYGREYKPADAIAANWREAHSVYVQTLGELGLAGVVTLLGLVVSLAYMVWRQRLVMLADPIADKFYHGVRAAVVASLIAWMVSGAFLSVSYYPHLFLLVMLTSCLERFALFHAVELPMIDEVEED